MVFIVFCCLRRGGARVGRQPGAQRGKSMENHEENQPFGQKYEETFTNGTVFKQLGWVVQIFIIPSFSSLELYENVIKIMSGILNTCALILCTMYKNCRKKYYYIMGTHLT